MRKTLLALILVLVVASGAHAIPDLQLFIDGATYDWHSQTWVTTSGGFDLYVVSANHSKNDVIVSMALAQGDDPSVAAVNFAGDPIENSDWVWGYAPIGNEPDEWNGGEDLPRHGIFPTWYSEVHTGAYNRGSRVGNTQPDSHGDFWNPATGHGTTSARGQFKMFHVTTGGSFTFVHFDAYTLNSDGSIDRFAPFSHDAEAGSPVPEPGTLALFGAGLLGLGTVSRKRKK
jgi:hypothetical protein